MRTNVVIDDHLMAEVMKATGLTTKRQAVDRGLRALLQQQARLDVLRLRGRLDWRGDLDAARTDE